VTARLGILASGSGSNAQAIAAAIAQGSLGAQIAVIITNNPEAGVMKRAQQLGIPVVLVNHRDFSSRQVFDEAVVKVLQDFGVEWVIMAGWMRRVTEIFLLAYPQRILNIHPSLLPSFPGVRAVEQALAYGVKVTGCTVHWVTLEVDQGPIIAQAAVPVFPEDTPATLHQRIQAQEHDLYPRAIAVVIEN